MAGIDINRTSAGVELPKEVSNEILATAQEQSAAMRLAQEVNLPGRGVSMPVITGDPEAEWVDETANKPVSRPTMGNKTMTPYKLAVIVPFSNEFKRDAAALYNELVNRLPGALGKKFDETIFHGTAPGSGFDVLSDAEAVSLATDAYDGLVNADAAVSLGGGLLNGWALSPQARGLLLAAKDNSDRPLFINNASDGAVDRLLGAPVMYSRGLYAPAVEGEEEGDPDIPALVGFAGDWTQAFYGTVEGVQISMSDQATLTDGATQINLWQRNMFAVRAEIEIGFVVRDKDAFVRLTN
jgi:HK97 family phage major capsid protein